MVKWLFEAGAAEDIRIENNDFWSPMHAACSFNRHHATRWLALHGAANNNEGHVDPAILKRVVHACHRLGIIT